MFRIEARDGLPLSIVKAVIHRKPKEAGQTWSEIKNYKTLTPYLGPGSRPEVVTKTAADSISYVAYSSSRGILEPEDQQVAKGLTEINDPSRPWADRIRARLIVSK